MRKIKIEDLSEDFIYIFGTYLSFETDLIYLMKGSIDNWRRYKREDFQREFRFNIDNGKIDPDTFERLTGGEYESQEELDIYLNRVYDYLFEDGPVPDWRVDLPEA